MTIDHGLKAVAWTDFNTRVLEARGMASERQRRFAAEKIYFGQLSLTLADQLREAVISAEIEPFRNDDFTPGFQTFEFNSSMVDTFNQNSQFRRFNAKEIWLLADLTDTVRDEIADCLGSPWALLSLKAWTTTPSATPAGPLGWHSDGFVLDVFKVMVYPVPLTEATGGFEFKDDAGQVIRHQSEQPGSWALFQNTQVLHRGVPGRSESRVALELTISRSAQFDLRPRFPGVNAHWPNFPWIGAVDGCPDRLAQMVEHRRVAIPT